jgi:hypothetical protein
VELEFRAKLLLDLCLRIRMAILIVLVAISIMLLNSCQIRVMSGSSGST